MRKRNVGAGAPRIARARCAIRSISNRQGHLAAGFEAFLATVAAHRIIERVRLRLSTTRQTTWVLAHALRGAMATEMKGHRISGKGEVVEIGAEHFGGHV